jgi:NADPH:quinone reductase-like Zn-dependent oxidoreductase
VRVHAASVNPADVFVMRGTPYVMRLLFGLDRPRQRVRGRDFAGTVEAVGRAVTRFRPGDAVFGSAQGAFADHVVAGQDVMAAKPEQLTFEQAAAVPMAGLAALHGLRDAAKVEPGQRVLIIGASGGVGTFAVQLATSFGAEVTGVCSTRNVELVRSLGADHVIDYTVEDVTAGAQRYDVILDNVATHPLGRLRGVLTRDGILLPNNGDRGDVVLGPLPRLLGAVVLSLVVPETLRPFVSTTNHDDLVALAGLIEAGAVEPVIDRTYPLAQTAQAVAHVATGHARGKVVVAVR